MGFTKCLEVKDRQSGNCDVHGLTVGEGGCATGDGIGAILGKLCSGGGAAACAAFPPAIPFCSILAGYFFLPS